MRCLLAALFLAGLLAVPAAGIEVTGHVIEHGSGAPLEEARVELRYLDGSQRAVAAITDDDGQFHLKVGTQERCRIEVTKLGYSNTVLFASIEGNLSITLRMIKGGVIAGRVTTESGAPVPRASIVVLGSSLLQRLNTNNAVFPAAMTDAQGAYRVFGLAPGSYAVGVISSMDATPAGTSPPQFLSMTAGEEYTNVDFTIPTTSAGSIDGRVEGATVEGEVLLALLPRDLPAAPLARALMDSSGGFRFTGIPAGIIRSSPPRPPAAAAATPAFSARIRSSTASNWRLPRRARWRPAFTCNQARRRPSNSRGPTTRPHPRVAGTERWC